ncbi:MAG TPA: hypothetical protein VFI31_16440 [Pirellulales bacterium]|nr:hypothetical protein [Pirellulales bacterium]
MTNDDAGAGSWRKKMPKKDGELRLLKSGAVYGPMSGDDFERLRSAGKVGPDELVSLRGGAWMTVADYLGSSPSAAAADATAPARNIYAAAAAALDDNDPVLRLLTGKRIVTSLSRVEVNQLRQSGRIDDDDLICALYGPWMRVGDFLAPPGAKPPATLLEEHADKPVAGVRAATLAAQPAPRPIAPVVIPGPTVAVPVSAPSIAPAPGSSLGDEWYVRVRGVHSAPLGKRHVKALFEAKEITRDNVARHPTWPDNAWIAIHAIPQLADCVA